VGRPTHSPRWGGAVAGWELTRLARRGSPTVARVLVGLLLFAALFVTYLAAFPQDLNQRSAGRIQARLSEFGQDFALTFLMVQAAVVLLVTPLFVAGAIVEETERRTLEFLLATDLSPREIILGKLWPRLLLVFGLVIAGWPVLAITQVWGGVDILFVAAASVVVLATTWAVAGISSACAVGARTLRKGIFRSYLWSVLALLLPIVTCPFFVISVLAELPAVVANTQTPTPGRRGPSAGPSVVFILIMFGFHFVVMLFIGVWGLNRATYKLRHARYFYARMPWQQRQSKLKHWEKHPDVPQGSPLLWKELYLSGQTNRFVKMLSLVPWVVWLCVCSVLMVMGWAAVIGDASDVYGSMNSLVRWAGGFLVGLMALMVGLHASGSVARERQQETLDDLLTIPRPRREILFAKWVGSMAKARGIALGAMAVPLVGVIAEGISYWAVLPLIFTAATIVACSGSFGIWLSVRSKSVQRATGLWLLITGLWVGGTFLAAQTAYMEDQAGVRSRTPPPPRYWDRMLNPPLAWSMLTFRFVEPEEPSYDWREGRLRDGKITGMWETLPSLMGIGFYAFLAWAFYAEAARRFEREGRG
jgi:ABC-type transport system involved in multi-copper enzyme maturation permease subunit